MSKLIRMRLAKAEENKLLKNLENSDEEKIEENFFYVLGGITKSRCDYIYIKKQKRWYPLPQMKRTYCNCCVIKKKMYVIGGREESIPQDTVCCFVNKNWVNLPLNLLKEKSESGIGVVDNKIFIIGGYGHACSDVEKYDPVQNTTCILKPKLQQGRYGHSVVAIGDIIYAIGGHKLNKYFSCVEKLNVNGELRWLLCSSMNRRRAYCAAVALSPFIYVFGGCGGCSNSSNIARLDSAERYDCRSDEWTILANMPSPRSNMACVKWGKKILIIGGIDDKKMKLKDILLYCPEKNSYDMFETKLPDWRFAHCAASE